MNNSSRQTSLVEDMDNMGLPFNIANIEEQVLSDGSIGFNVILFNSGTGLSDRLACNDKDHAVELAKQLNKINWMECL
jgi:hypothetical protein